MKRGVRGKSTGNFSRRASCDLVPKQSCFGTQITNCHPISTPRPISVWSPDCPVPKDWKPWKHPAGAPGKVWPPPDRWRQEQSFSKQLQGQQMPISGSQSRKRESKEMPVGATADGWACGYRGDPLEDSSKLLVWAASR